IADIKNKTDFQNKRIGELKDLIKRMKENKIGDTPTPLTEMKMDRRSRVPIILFDEAEKVKHPSVLDALGKIMDDNQRKEILSNRATDFVRQFFPATDTTGKVDKKKDQENKEKGILTPYQQKIRDMIGERTIENCITATWGIRDWDSDESLDDDDKSDKVRRLRYDDLNGEELVLTKKIDYDFVAKEKNKKWSAVLHPLDADEGEQTDQETVERLKREIARVKRECQDEINRHKEIDEIRRAELETALHALEQAGTDKERLQAAIDDLTEQLRRAGLEKPEMKEVETQTELPYLSTMEISRVPENGVVRFGVSPFEQRTRVLTFDPTDADKIKKLTVLDCQELIQIDLKGLTNLEKLTLKNSKWDNIKNAKECLKLEKVSIKDCVEVSVDFLAGTNVEFSENIDLTSTPINQKNNVYADVDPKFKNLPDGITARQDYFSLQELQNKYKNATSDDIKLLAEHIILIAGKILENAEYFDDELNPNNISANALNRFMNSLEATIDKDGSKFHLFPPYDKD
ncbi:7330_t:CDS:2, partial [Racocetra persica]